MAVLRPDGDDAAAVSWMCDAWDFVERNWLVASREDGIEPVDRICIEPA